MNILIFTARFAGGAKNAEMNEFSIAVEGSAMEKYARCFGEAIRTITSRLIMVI